MMLAVLLVLIIFCLACLIYRAEKSDVQKIHRQQQEALRRHYKQQEADRKRYEGYWRERGKVIRPRFRTELDELGMIVLACLVVFQARRHS
jgi:Tfp pilus assembly protein PilO